MDYMAFETIQRLVSPMPMGRTPGFLSSAIRRQARRGESVSGSTLDTAIRRATEASELHRSAEADWKEVHKCCQTAASMPEGPAAPSVFEPG